mgnify:CR=1 FL=1
MNERMGFTIIVAHDDTYGIGLEGRIPWSHPDDLSHFARITKGGVVIMGRITYESIPNGLPGRQVIVLTSSLKWGKDNSDIFVVHTIAEAEKLAYKISSETSPGRVYIAGGAIVYKEFIQRGLVASAIVTRISGDYGCDCHFPVLQNYYVAHRSKSHTDPALVYETHIARRNPCESSYLRLVKNAIEHGVRRSDRTGTGTRSVFGASLRFDLSNNTMPLLTTKRVFWRGLVEELLWFLRGETDSKTLAALGVNIWNANGSRKFLDERGLYDYPVGELGPVYGHQWRHFDKPYCADSIEKTKTKYVDQIRYVIDLLRRDPTTRRALLSAWNPNQLGEMALPPCHVSYHFMIGSDRDLHCVTYQRSGDLGLGVPFNIASAALLTHLVAYATGTHATGLVINLGDAHVYENHIEPLQRQLRRVPRSFPKVTIDPSVPKDTIWTAKSAQILLSEYDPCTGVIRMKMAV